MSTIVNNFRSFVPDSKVYCRKYGFTRTGDEKHNNATVNMEKGDWALLALTYIILITVISIIVSFSLQAGSYAVNNTLSSQISSGTFDTRGDITNKWSVMFTNMAGRVFGFALPFMSAFTLTMITLSLVSSIIFLTKPDLFNEVHDLVQERKGNKGGGNPFSGFVDYYKQKGIRDFALSYCIDFKSWAFQDSVTAGIDGAPTFQDLLRNMPKYILMFTFCILISNRVLLDFLLTGAQLTSRLFEKATYDYNYVEIMENFIDSGKRYVPQQWTTRDREGTNKMSVYRAIYNTTIANLDMTQKDTESLRIIGMNIEEYIEEHIIPNEHWDRKVFSAKSEYATSRKHEDREIPGTYFISGSKIGMIPEEGSAGFVMLYIGSQPDSSIGIGTGITKYPGAWSPQDTLPDTFDISKIPGIPSVGETGNVTKKYKITGSEFSIMTTGGQPYRGSLEIDNDTGIITLKYDWGSGDEATLSKQVSRITIPNLRVEVVTTLAGQDHSTTSRHQIDIPVWVNSNPENPEDDGDGGT